MFSLPSFFSFPFTLPSLPSISLPANIQRRFLSYVLKRALGNFVKAGGLDVERIQAQISEGWVEIEGLEVDTEAVNALLPSSLPITLISGSLAKVTARVPFPNLWSDPLAITLDSLSLDFALSTSKRKPKASPVLASTSHYPPTSPSIDLAASFTSAADDFLHDELDAYEGAELDRSIRQSLILNQSDPFVQDDLPGAFPFFSPVIQEGQESRQPLPATTESSTVLAGLVERILARLQLKVNTVRVRLRFNDGVTGGGSFELRIANIRYADESGEGPFNSNLQTIRAVRVSGISLWLLPVESVPTSTRDPERPGRFQSSTSRSSSTSSTSSASTDSRSGYGDMVMSQAVADLRQSMASSIASGASVYESAYGGSLTSGRQEDDSSGRSTRSATPTADRPVGDAQGFMVLSFGSDDVVVKLRTSQPQASVIDQSVEVDTTSARPVRPVPERSSTSFSDSSAPAQILDLTLGTIACLAFPNHLASVMGVLQAITSHETSSVGNTDPAVTTSSGRPQLQVRLEIKAFHLAMVYDMNASLVNLVASIQQFWAKPGVNHLPVDHIKLRMEGLEAKLVSKGQSALHRKRPNPDRTIPGRTTSFPIGDSARNPTLTMRLHDASLFEHLHFADNDAESVDESPPGGVFPVFIFDHSLHKQYDLAPGGNSAPFLNDRKSGISPKGPARAAFPEYDCVDWRNAGVQRRVGGGERSWKTKVKGRGVLKGTQVADTYDGPVLTVEKEMSSDSAAVVEAEPIHVFLDLSLVERLLPMLRCLAPLVKADSKHVPASTPIAHQRPSVPIRRDTQYVLDDLDGQASSLSTLRAAQPKDLLIIRCPMVRLDIRCPAPLNRRGSWGDGAHLRSGIVSLDVHNIVSTVTSGSSHGRRPGMQEKETNTHPVTQIEWQKMIFFLCKVPDKRSSAFLVVGPLATEQADEGDDGILLPSISTKPVASGPNEDITRRVICRIPSVQAKIHQQTVEGLQFFADDMTHWLNGAFGDGSAPRPRDDLKMIGSRFFGSKGSNSSSSAADDDDGLAGGGLSVQVVVSEVDIALYIPRLSSKVEGSVEERILSLKASDVETVVESNISGRQETVFKIAIMNADICDLSSLPVPVQVCGRTTPLSLTTHTQPLLNFRFASTTDPSTDTKESDIKLLLSHFTFYLNKDWEWIQELKAFAKTPEGVFEDVVPTEITRINLRLYDSSIHVAAPSVGGGLVCVLGDVQIKTDLISDSDDNTVEVSTTAIFILAVDDLKAIGDLPVGMKSSVEAWKRAGFAQLVEVSKLDLQLYRDLTGNEELVLDILQAQIRVTACADSLATVGALVGDMAKLAPHSDVAVTPVAPPSMLQDIDVFASIDQDAFNQIPDIVTGADMIDDDLPTNLDYLDQSTRPVPAHLKDRSAGETLRTWEPAGFGEDDHRFAAELNGETIRILYEKPFDMIEDYLDTLPVVNGGYGEETKLGRIRVRLHDCSVNVYLHDGFDWTQTRKIIEDEIKTVRKRLEKIRQLLASGHKADETMEIEGTSTTLFNSVYIGLQAEQAVDKLDTAALLKAIDEEIDDLGGGDTASQSSWQSLPRGERNTSFQQTTRKSLKLRGKKLTRSKSPQIEIALSGLKADVDLFDVTETTASKIHVTIAKMEILDHIKTSTWKKFLTEMKADSRGNVRETDADMVRVELVVVRPNLPSLDEENRLKAKILPLRLHIDQDALDFLKRFFSFSSPNKGEPTKQSENNEPFFQHVEVFPIELKLDYKPKRVDFAALREGKTMELMNFFHFDGAEMTLRHITLSGITGWSKLSTTLNDIWTPDVKANQLIDVISGVSPIRSMVNVGSGVADLILLPIEQYRKDGRLAKGVQRGTNSFVRTTASEMMKLGARLATGTQVLLEGAEGMLGGSSGTTSSNIANNVNGNLNGGRGTGRTVTVIDGGFVKGSGNMEGESDEEGDDGPVVVSRFANQPGDVTEGVQAAYKSLSRNINSAAQTILAVPMEVYERSNEDGPLRAVVRAVPIAVLKPMIGGAEAVSKTLLGLRNSIDPEGRRELGDKYK